MACAAAPGAGAAGRRIGTVAPITPPDDTLSQILGQLRRLLDCSGCALLMVDRRSKRIEPAASWFASDAVRAAMEPVLSRPIDPERPGITEVALQRDETLLLRDIAAWPAAAGLRARLDETLGREAARTAWDWYRSSTLISAPVSTAGGRSFGVLAIAATAPGPEDLHAVEVFADLAALALERDELLARERRIAQALARGLVPQRQAGLEGLRLGVLYEPAEAVTGGGDFFGAWPLGGGLTALLVGDVSGKGLEVAATSAMARFFFEAVSSRSLEPARVLEEVDRLLCRRSVDGLIPAFFAVCGEGELRWSNAGHQPPLVLPANGGAFEELGQTGIPLAVEASARWDERRCAFGPGDVLLAFTDGLVDARGPDGHFGEPRLHALLNERRQGEDPQALVDGLYAEVAGWATTLQDDIVVLAAQAC